MVCHSLLSVGADAKATLEKGSGMTLNAPTRRLVGAGSPHTTKRDDLPLGDRPQLRPCRINWLLPDGGFDDTRLLIPAHPLFEDAFCAFARGSLIETPQGPLAIEDLLPGDRVMTADGSAQKVIWIGSTTLVPTPEARSGRHVPLFRIMPDALGLGRPMSHMVIGPSARMLGESGQTLKRVCNMEDGVHVARLSPPSPVDVYHLCLEDHGLIRAGGILCESYHPGTTTLSDVGPAMRELFLKLFPHIHHVSDFGILALPRDRDELDGASLA